MFVVHMEFEPHVMLHLITTTVLLKIKSELRISCAFPVLEIKMDILELELSYNKLLSIAKISSSLFQESQTRAFWKGGSRSKH